jgi:hypothetical protein
MTATLFPCYDPEVTRSDRFLTSARVAQPDRVPMFDFLFQQPLYERLVGERPEGYRGDLAVKCALALDHDGVWLPFGGFTGYQPKYVAEDTYYDEWGTLYRKTASSWPIDAPIDYPIKSRLELRSYRPPDPTLPGRTAEIESARDMDNGGMALLGGVQGAARRCSGTADDGLAPYGIRVDIFQPVR